MIPSFISALFLGLILIQSICLAAPPTLAPDAASAALTVNVSPQAPAASGSCAYNFADSYDFSNGTPQEPQTTLTNPFQAEGPVLNLSFSGYDYNNGTVPKAATTPVPCDGYYDLFFTVTLRNDGGTGCDDGLLSLAIWATTNDPSLPYAYGCPTRYYNPSTAGTTLPPTSTDFKLTPDATHTVPYACSTFNWWVQCSYMNSGLTTVWGSNSAHPGSESLVGIAAWPIFSMTTKWLPTSDNKVWDEVYNPGGISYINEFPYAYMYPYPGHFCSNVIEITSPSEQNYCAVNSATNGQQDSPSVLTYPSKGCTERTFYFKAKIFLHAGATVSAPSLQALYTQEPFLNGGFNGDNFYTCPFSVVSGLFKLTYLSAS